jgi:hypothetical protein
MPKRKCDACGKEKDIKDMDKTNKSELSKIVAEKLHRGDKISEQIEEMEFSVFNNEIKEKILNELFDVKIRMVDNGDETDTYFVHY